MTALSFDFSKKPELTSLAYVVRDLSSVAKSMGIDFFLMGAAARDLMLRDAYGINTGRHTTDVDFSVMVDSWTSFAALRKGLIDNRNFLERPGPATHRLRHATTGLPLDIVPFGAIERTDRKIAWPPEHSTVFDCFGIQEAFNASLSVLLPENIPLEVAGIPGLALLKIAAWQDRHHTIPGRDAVDLLLYLRHYLDCGNFDRAGADHADLFEMDDYDHEATSARLLGRDMALLLDKLSTERVLEILLPQADPQRPGLLVQQSGRDLEHARRSIAAVCDGLLDRI